MKIIVVSHERSGTHLTLNSMGEFNCVNVPESSKEEVNDFLYNYKGDNILKSHHQSYFFNDDIFEKFKVIYISRNTLDTLTSMYFYYKNNPHAFPTFKDIDEFVFSDRTDVSNYCYKKSKNFIERHLNHLESYKGKDVINVSYEEIINDYSSYVKKMNEAGITVTSTKPSLHWGVTVCPRKGIIGDYINHMSEELINKITSYKLNNS